MSKLSIFDSAWTDMVFEGRNKEYGAYQLRKENPRTTFIALFIAFILLGIALAVPGIARYFSPTEFAELPIDALGPTIFVDNIKPPEHVDPPKPQAHDVKPPAPQPVAPPVNSLANTQLTKDHETAVQPANPQTQPMIDNTTGPSGPTNSNSGPTGPVSAQPDTEKPSDGPMLAAAVDVQPTFPGGMDKFYRYVSNNFKAPEDDNVAGRTMKVIVYFVIEKDGSMSDIKVLRNPGYGMDKEAIRVLKSLKIKWTPGKIKNQEVRTAYTLPITVQAPN